MIHFINTKTVVLFFLFFFGRGILYIAEVESRFEDIDNFTSSMVHFGFTLKKKDISHQMFIFMDFKKARKVTKSGKLPELTLEPCLYKRR